MVKYDRVKAQQRADVNQTLVRELQADWNRLNSKLRLIEGEMDGAQKVIEQKQRQIEVARAAAEELRRKLAYLGSQASELDHDPARWGITVQRAV